MRTSLLFVSISLVAAACFSQAIPVFAADAVVQTKCVTVATKAMYAADLARMEKDIAPYAANDGVVSTIRTYRNGIEIAWEAMEQPYCGTGSSGFASAKKSYSKTVERVRAAFLANVKKPAAAIEAIPTPAPEPVPAVKPLVVAAPSADLIPRGL